ncbi:unnamed protein product, partial [Owenia fusiformis]
MAMARESTGKRRSCMQFADCEDRTTEHRNQFIHSSDIPPFIDYSDRPPCWYWETCYRHEGTEHMTKYLHPWELENSSMSSLPKEESQQLRDALNQYYDKKVKIPHDEMERNKAIVEKVKMMIKDYFTK